VADSNLVFEGVKLALSAGLGFVGGLFGERHRRRAFTIDAELARLDDLIDAASERAMMLQRGSACSPELMASFAGKRQRLGQNLKRLFGTTKSYPALATKLALFANHLARLDPPEGEGPPAQLPEDICDRGEELSKAIKVCAAEDPIWKMFMRR